MALHLNINAEIRPRIYAIEVIVRETYQNYKVIDTEWYTIKTFDQSDARLTATHDRTENGNGVIYYCYGRKYGYCNMSY